MYIYLIKYNWKQRYERLRFEQFPFAIFFHKSTYLEKKYNYTCYFNIVFLIGKP